MKTEKAVQIVKQKLPGWTVVKTQPAEDAAVAPAPKKVGKGVRVLMKKYSFAPTEDAAPAKQVKLKTNGVSIIRVQPKKRGQDSLAYTKSVVVGDEGVIGMQG